MAANDDSALPRVGVSSCLLGERVRYDGRHKLHSFVVDDLARFVQLVPTCPEVEVGMGTPREPIELVEIDGEERLVGVESRRDHTDTMNAFAARRAEELERLGLCGYVFKSKSPSCGVETGLFARRVLERLDTVPAVEESALDDLDTRDEFLTRVFALQRAGRASSDLAAFIQREKLLLLAREPQPIDAGDREFVHRRFRSALQKDATLEGHRRVFERLRSAVSVEGLPVDVAKKLHAAIDSVIERPTRRIVVLDAIRYYLRHCGLAALAEQSYFDPYPAQLRPCVAGPWITAS